MRHGIHLGPGFVRQPALRTEPRAAGQYCRAFRGLAVWDVWPRVPGLTWSMWSWGRPAALVLQ